VTVVEGQRRFAAPRERVFELLTTPDVVASALPVVRSYQVLSADHWRAKVKPPLPLAPAVTIRFEVLERQPPAHAALHAHGGGADVTSRFDLEDDGAETLMHWRTELHLAGLLDRLAGHGLDALAHRQATRTLDAVERAL
jgi:carbon monoxide dehydrogenase subunit G